MILVGYGPRDRESKGFGPFQNLGISMVSEVLLAFESAKNSFLRDLMIWRQVFETARYSRLVPHEA